MTSACLMDIQIVVLFLLYRHVVLTYFFIVIVGLVALVSKFTDRSRVNTQLAGGAPILKASASGICIAELLAAGKCYHQRPVVTSCAERKFVLPAKCWKQNGE
jgi:hypothetical protein